MKLTDNRIKPAEFARNIWAVTPDHGTLFSALGKPDYWAHVAAKLRPNDRIEVLPEDGSYFAELLVVSADRLWAKVIPLRFIELEAKAAPDLEPKKDGEFELRLRGPQKWSIIRLSDKSVLSEGHQTKVEAQKWLDNYRHQIAA